MTQWWPNLSYQRWISCTFIQHRYICT